MSYFSYNDRKVFYTDRGRGEPLLIIHGNSVSSKMHRRLGKRCAGQYRVISPDLPGHGRSERIENWEVDYWFEHSKAVHALIRHLGLSKTILLGYSGGALVALNTALEHPEDVKAVIADSFEGEKSVPSFAQNIFADRAKDKKNILARIFWFSMHGRDWEDVVDSDTSVIYEHHRRFGLFFHQDLSELKIPVLLTGSRKDEYIEDFEQFYSPLEEKFGNCRTIIYEDGRHPSALNSGRFFEDLAEFIRGL